MLTMIPVLVLQHNTTEHKKRETPVAMIRRGEEKALM
jgi:hypothetical protein